MNKIIMFFFLGLFAIMSTNIVLGQDITEAQVPQAVKAAFKAKYKDNFVYEWDYKRKTKEYEAEFLVDGIKNEAYFTANGEWVRTERDIKNAQVPTVIFETVRSSEYATWKIDDIEELVTPKYAQIYRVKVELGAKERYLFVTLDSKIVEVKNKK